MEENIPTYASNASFILVIVSLVLAVFGIIVGFQVGSELAKNVASKKEYLQKSAIAYGITIVFSAMIWMTGYVVLSFLAIGALGGLIAGMTMSYGEDLGPFKMAQKFAGRKLPTSKGKEKIDEEKTDAEQTEKEEIGEEETDAKGVEEKAEKVNVGKKRKKRELKKHTRKVMLKK